jgi:UTRA domain-containing protein
MARYGIARMTARQALGVLTTEGIAAARKGAGVFVRDFTPIIREALTRLSHERWAGGAAIWSADAKGRDLSITTTVSETEPREHIAALLALDEAERVLVRARRFVLDGKPVLLSTSYFPQVWWPTQRSRRRTQGPAARTPGSPSSAMRPLTSGRTSAPALGSVAPASRRPTSSTPGRRRACCGAASFRRCGCRMQRCHVLRRRLARREHVTPPARV